MTGVATGSSGLMEVDIEGGSGEGNEGGSCCGLMEVGNEGGSGWGYEGGSCRG
jgi:hypothetical protein